MTVAAVVLAPSVESAMRDAAGRPSVRRIVESAWAGGAVPIVVVAAADPNGAVAQALAGSPARLVGPAPKEDGPVGQIVRGMRAVLDQVVETDAALVWPARMVWADPETVTSLIERHGVSAGLLRPTYDDQPGWPALVPFAVLDDLAGLGADRMPDDLLADLEAKGVQIERVDVGDPGVVLDRETPIDSLPTYQGPPEPVGGPPPEWGLEDAADREDTALEGPALTPYGQAADPEAADDA